MIKLLMLRRISSVHPRAQYRNGSAASVERFIVSHAVDAPGHTADHGKAQRSQAATQITGYSPSIMTRTARANHGYGLIIFPPNLALYVKTRRRVSDAAQTSWIDSAAKWDDFHSRVSGALHLLLNLIPLRES